MTLQNAFAAHARTRHQQIVRPHLGYPVVTRANDNHPQRTERRP